MPRSLLARSTPFRLGVVGALVFALAGGLLPLHPLTALADADAARDGAIVPSSTALAAADSRNAAFIEEPNTYYALHRSLPTWGGPTLSIARMLATETTAGNSPVSLGGRRTLSGVNGHSVNALGVGDDGVFYFTTQRDITTQSGGVSIWEYRVMGLPGTDQPSAYCPGTTSRPTGSRAEGWACAPKRLVTNLSLNSGVRGGGTIVGGAVNPLDGAFYFTYFSGTPDAASALNPTGSGNVRAHVYRYDPVRAAKEGWDAAGEVMHVDVRKHKDFVVDRIDIPNATGYLNGDIAFDGQGNLLLTVSNPVKAADAATGQGEATGQMMLAMVPWEDYKDFDTRQWQENTETVPTVEPRSTIGAHNQPARYNPISRVGRTNVNDAVNGVAYTSSGLLVVEQGQNHAVASPTTFEPRGSAITMTSTGGEQLVDLASARVPATITLRKNFLERHDPSDQVQLTGSLAVDGDVTVLDTVTTTGDTPGVQTEQIGPLPFEGRGTLTLGETLVPAANAELYSTEYACYAAAPPYSTLVVDATRPFLVGTGTSISIDYVQQMARAAGIVVGSEFDQVGNVLTDGFSITCDITNGPLEPELVVSKSAVPESMTNVAAGDVVQYRLTFNNSEGLAPADIDHVDHLRDVLDDATFSPGSIRYGDGTETAYPSDGAQPLGVGVSAREPDAANQLAVEGIVPAKSVRTVWFEVVVKSNSEPRPAGSGAPYELINHLVPTGEPVPSDCAEGSTTCTAHSVPAWTVSKTSNPLPGAWVHDGGNVYYSIDVRKVGTAPFELAGISIVDDMSEVMSVGRMDEDAPTYGGEYGFAVRTFDSTGAVVRDFGAGPDRAWDDRSFEVSDLHPVHTGSSDPADPSWRWTLQLPPFTLAESEVRAQIMYVVQVGGAADPADPRRFQLEGDAVRYAPPRMTTFANTVAGDSPLLQPNECRAGSEPDPGCTVAHTIADHYFHIQKNSTSRDEFGNVLWNLTDAAYEIRDYAPAAGWPAGLPAAQLCRSNYAATYDAASDRWSLGDPVGTYVPGAAPDWMEGSATYESLIAYNDYARMNGLDQVELCALFYGLDDASYGQAPGTWHARNLDEGAYQLVETRAPEGHQLLAQTIPFVVGPASGGHQLDLLDRANPELYLDRCTDPAQLPSNGAEACVMSVGWLLQVYDTKLQRLPMAGGLSTLHFTLVGSLILLVGLIAVIVRMMRRGERPYNPLASRTRAH